MSFLSFLCYSWSSNQGFVANFFIIILHNSIFSFLSTRCSYASFDVLVFTLGPYPSGRAGCSCTCTLRCFALHPLYLRYRISPLTSLLTALHPLDLGLAAGLIHFHIYMHFTEVAYKQLHNNTATTLYLPNLK